LNLQPVSGGKSLLVNIDLHRHGHAGQHAWILAPSDLRIDYSCFREHLGRPVIDHGIELRIDRVEPRQRCRRRFLGRHLFGFDQASQIRGRQTPEVLHYQLRFSSCSAGSMARPYCLTRFLHANRRPLRSKTPWREVQRTRAI
jgi:hypothetical protein